MTLDRFSADLDLWEDLRLTRPLTLWRAWDRPAPRTSQLRALQLLAVLRTVFVFGGNRSGKTELLRAALVALVLGSDHPDARAFWLAHGVDPKAFPRGPGRAWIVALRASDSLEYHRQPILNLIPKWGPRHPDSEGEGLNWHARGLHGKDEARLEIMCPGYTTPAEIVFKSDDPGPESMQGSNVRAILHDEESRKWGSATWEECTVRLIDQRGWHLMANTPTRGRTWLYEEHVRERHDDEGVIWIHSPDNPYLPASELKKLERDPTVAAIRLRGEFVATEGRVWPQFRRHIHVLPASIRDLIPRDAPRFRVIDFGTRDPHCCLWAAVLKSRLTLPDGRTLHERCAVVYREHYRTEWTLAQHVDEYRRLEGWVRNEAGRWERTPTTETITLTWADPEDPQQVLALNRDHGIMAVKARKARDAGIDRVAEWLTPDHTGEPRLYILDCCPNTIREVGDYVWVDRVVDGKPAQVPDGRSDHACDDLRYLTMGLTEYL